MSSRADELEVASGALWSLTHACAYNCSAAKDAGAVPALLGVLAHDWEAATAYSEHAAAALVNITSEVASAGAAVGARQIPPSPNLYPT